MSAVESQEVPFACPPPFFCTVAQIRGAGSLDGEFHRGSARESHAQGNPSSRDKRKNSVEHDNKEEWGQSVALQHSCLDGYGVTEGSE